MTCINNEQKISTAEFGFLIFQIWVNNIVRTVEITEMSDGKILPRGSVEFIIIYFHTISKSMGINFAQLEKLSSLEILVT